MEKISDSDFDFLRGLSEEWMGSVFSPDKKYLFETRLINMAKEFGYTDIKSLITELKLKKDNLNKDKKEYFVDIITTHETLFFRDKSPFKNLRDHILPSIMENGNPMKGINIYSAACSTGQEPVSMVMALCEGLSKEWLDKLSITATDISKMAVQYAQEGLYSQYEVQRGVPTRLLNSYFEQEGISWRFKEEYKKYINYRIENLCKPDYKIRKFDIVFCRNATIYMDPPKVRKIYEHFHQSMNTGGYIVIGHSERMSDHTDLFEYIKVDTGVIYKRVD